MDRELLLLGLLRQGNMHGYQLNEFIEHEMAMCTDLKKSTAYFLLDKMEKQGWVARGEQQQEGNRPPRRVYGITAEGEREFQRLLRENLADYEPRYFVGDVGLAFSDALSADERRALLEVRLEKLRGELASARNIPAHAGFLGLVITHRIAHLESELHFLEGVIAHLEELPGSVA